MNSMFFSGETEARAILAAANHFGVSPEQIAFDRVEKRHGFVKHRRVVIRVDPASVGRSVDGEAASDSDGPAGVAAERIETEAPAAAPATEENVTAAPETEAAAAEAAAAVETEAAAAGPEAAAKTEAATVETAAEAETGAAADETDAAAAVETATAAGETETASAVETETAAQAAGTAAAVETETTAQAAGTAAAVEAEASAPATDDVLAVAHGALNQLLELADLEVSAEMVLTDERLEVEIEGVDEDLLTEDEGQVLLALQHLLPRVMYGQLGRIVPCRLDSGGYQRKKEERLRGLARRVAEEVASRGGIRTLRPMNPADRRIVHLTLADDPDVETESQGNGYFKRVAVRAL